MTDWIEALLGESEEEAEDEERSAPDGEAELGTAQLPRAETVSEPEEEPEPAPEGWTDGAADASEREYRPEAGETVELPEPERPPYRRPWDEGAEDPGTLPRALTAAVMDAGGAGLPAGPMGRTAVQPSPVAVKPEQSGAGDRGLAELYRQTAQAVRPATPAVTPAQAGSRVLEREDAGGPPLTAEELDRAVRRDSRRYDGGMSIF